MIARGDIIVGAVERHVRLAPRSGRRIQDMVAMARDRDPRIRSERDLDTIAIAIDGETMTRTGEGDAVIIPVDRRVGAIARDGARE